MADELGRPAAEGAAGGSPPGPGRVGTDRPAPVVGRTSRAAKADERRREKAERAAARSKEAREQAAREAGRAAGEQAGRRAARHTSEQAAWETAERAGRLSGDAAGREAAQDAARQGAQQAARDVTETAEQAVEQAARKAGREAGLRRSRQRPGRASGQATRSSSGPRGAPGTSPASSTATRAPNAPTAPPTAPRPRAEIAEQLHCLLQAGHPRQALVTALAVGAGALLSGRPPRECLVAGGAVLVVQVILGLVNDLVDRERDLTSGVTDKPIADGRLPAGNASFAATCLAVVAVPLSLQSGVGAAAALLGFLLAGLASHVVLRRTVLSWLPWAVGYALLPATLSYGGWGAGLHGGPPSWPLVATAALLGVGVHFLLSLPDLVADHKTGIRHLPLRVALRIGAPRLLVVSRLYTAVVLVAMAIAASEFGLRR